MKRETHQLDTTSNRATTDTDDKNLCDDHKANLADCYKMWKATLMTLSKEDRDTVVHRLNMACLIWPEEAQENQVTYLAKTAWKQIRDMQGQQEAGAKEVTELYAL